MGTCGVRMHRHLHLRSRRAVTQRVIQQVAQQHTQQHFIGRHGARLISDHSELLLACQGGRRQLPGNPAHQGAQINGARLGIGRCFQSCQCQKLIHQATGAVAAGQRRLQCMGAFGHIVARSQSHLGLGTNGGNRRAQLVRRIRGKSALGLHHAVNALE